MTDNEATNSTEEQTHSVIDKSSYYADILATVEFSKREFSFILSEGGREIIREKLKAAAKAQNKTISDIIEELEMATDPYKVTNVTIDNNERSITLEVDRDLPEGASGLLSYYLLYLWILRGLPRKSTEAKNSGAIMTPGSRLLTITDKDFQSALSTKRNKNAYILTLDSSTMSSLEFTDGILNAGTEQIDLRNIHRITANGAESLKMPDLVLLLAFLTAAFQNRAAMTRDTIDVYYPSFLGALGIDVKPHAAQIEESCKEAEKEAETVDEILARVAKAFPYMEKLRRFKDCMGVINGRVLLEVFHISGIDPDRQILTISMPYFLRLFDIVEKKNTTEKITKKQPYTLRPWYCWLVHSKIISERNKPAVEIAIYLTTKLMQRNAKPDAEIWKNREFKDKKQSTFSTKFSSIVRDIPILRDRLSAAKSTSQKNQVLRRAFSKAYELMHTRTDAYQYFIDLTINEIIPTADTMETYLTITHRGINGDFAQQKNRL